MIAQHDRFTYRTGYWDDPAARAEFKRFLVEIHGLDLTLWEECGFWDTTTYRPFSLFDGDRMVAHMCLYSLDMGVKGRARRVGQFSGVGTAESHRRQGLGRWLTERALEWAAPDHDGFFLYSTEGAVEFYRGSGFTPAVEVMDVLEVETSSTSGELTALDTESPGDRDRFFQIARDRAPVSDILGCLNPRLLMYHWLYSLRERAHWIPELDVVVLCGSDGERLTLYDVVGRRTPSFEELRPYLAGFPHSSVAFYFPTDRMRITPTSTVQLGENLAHVRAPFALPGGTAVFPYTAAA